MKIYKDGDSILRVCDDLESAIEMIEADNIFVYMVYNCSYRPIDYNDYNDRVGYCVIGNTQSKNPQVVVSMTNKWGEILTIDSMLSTLLHEYAHILDFRSGKFHKYYNAVHQGTREGSLKEGSSYARVIKASIRFGLRAEQHADFLGEKMMNMHFPDHSFQNSYKADIAFGPS